MHSNRIVLVFFRMLVLFVFLFASVPILSGIFRQMHTIPLVQIGLTNLVLQNPSSSVLPSFERIIAYAPDNVLARRILARYSLLSGDSDTAVRHLEIAHRSRVADQMVLYELAEAYDDSGKYESASKIWGRLPVSVEYFIERSDHYLEQNSLLFAFRSYRRAIVLDSYLDTGLIYRGAGLAVLAGELREAHALLERLNDVKVFELARGSDIVIDGMEFRFLTQAGPPNPPGRALDAYPDGKAGGFHNRGQAVVFIDIQQAGNYQLTSRLLHHQPAPIRMALGVDNEKLRLISLDKGNGSWENVSTEVSLSRGLHLISVWFINDGVINGKSRHAALDQVELREQR